ncbi:MAG: 4Fe-4S binding protein, partial [Rubrivivax sp.]
MDEATVIKQHLIDPEICIRCNTCESVCPVGAITHDSRNYVVDAEVCNLCMACISPCPTGSIDNWRTLPRAMAYPIVEQFEWDELPPEREFDLPAANAADSVELVEQPAQAVDVPSSAGVAEDAPFQSAAWCATTPPWSAAHPYTNLYGPRNAISA